MSSAAKRRKRGGRVSDGGACSERSNATGSSSTSSKRIHTLPALGCRLSGNPSQRQVLYVDLVQQVLRLSIVALREGAAAPGQIVVRVGLQHLVELLGGVA